MPGASAQISPFGRIIALVQIALLGIYAFHAAEDTTGFDTAVLFIMCQLTPVVWMLAIRQNSYLLFFGFAHFGFSGLGKWDILWSKGAETTFATEQIIAMKESIFCYLIVFLVYSFARTMLTTRSLQKESYQTFPIPLGLLVTAILIILCKNTAIEEMVPTNLLNFYNIGRRLLTVICLCAVCPAVPRLSTFAKIAVFATEAKSFVDVAFLGTLINALLLAAFVVAIERRYRTLVLYGIGISLVLLLQPVKGTYRKLLQEGTIENSTAGRFDKLTELLELTYGKDSEVESDAIKKDVLNRFDEDTLSRVIRLTPAVVPFWDGETYQDALFVLIPRFIWKDKPKKDWQNKFGRVYQVLGDDDYDTAISCDYFSEGYINFGFSGMYFAALMVGLSLAIVEWAAHAFFARNYVLPYLLGGAVFLSTEGVGSLLNNSIMIIVVLFGLSMYLKSLGRKSPQWALLLRPTSTH